ncbi:zonadhesin-like [Arctopsyche grandis]|uniref:zonadhesin-like n=1 Tax=Arctopsyche grandis TaxID=121162 RepID=UPI00406D6D28
MAYFITTAIILTSVAILTMATAQESITRCQNPNETYSSCDDPCPTTCANKDQEPKKCLAICENEGACICKPEYIRGWNQNCIKPEECPTCEGPNEFFSCGSACDTTCETMGKKCDIFNKKCTEMCYCKEGFARDSKGVCIPINDCPAEQCKDDPNAIELPCGDMCPLTCGNKDEKGSRYCFNTCIRKGCKCKYPFVKDNADKCIPVESCPDPIKCGEDEIYDSCSHNCPPEETCISYISGVTAMCSPQTKCIPACICKKGYIRDKYNGKCIPLNGCCSDQNSEVVECPNPCPGGTCDEPEITPCKIYCSFRGCQCKKGFVKNSETNTTCVAIENCELSLP